MTLPSFARWRRRPGAVAFSYVTPAGRWRFPRRGRQRGGSMRAVPDHPKRSPPRPTGPRYSARVALSCRQGHAPGPVLHALQELRSVIDDRLRAELGAGYDRHNARSAGTDKLTVNFTLHATTHADAIRAAGMATATLAELLSDRAADVDLSGVALVIRAE